MEFFLTFIVPVLIMAGLAVVFGFVLEFFGRKLAVKRDPKLDEVVGKLAGSNCGGCGYGGCEAFAKALLAGEAALASCAPTDKRGKDAIAAVLGQDDAGGETVVVVNCNGGKNCRDKFEYHGYGSCTTAEIIAEGNKECYVGCMCLGTCSDACGYDAIRASTDKMHAEVFADKCVSCGACVSVCPKKLLSRIPKAAKVHVACSNELPGREVAAVCKTGCIGCGLCKKRCPEGAVEIENNLARIDYRLCTGCLKCAEACPTKVIKIRA